MILNGLHAAAGHESAFIKSILASSHLLIKIDFSSALQQKYPWTYKLGCVDIWEYPFVGFHEDVAQGFFFFFAFKAPWQHLSSPQWAMDHFPKSPRPPVRRREETSGGGEAMAMCWCRFFQTLGDSAPQWHWLKLSTHISLLTFLCRVKIRSADEILKTVCVFLFSLLPSFQLCLLQLTPNDPDVHRRLLSRLQISVSTWCSANNNHVF